MEREVLACNQGHELRPIGEGISYCIGGRRFEDTGERWIWLWEVAPSDAAWRFPARRWMADPLRVRDYKARIFDERYYGTTNPTESDARAFAMDAIRQLMEMTA